MAGCGRHARDCVQPHARANTPDQIINRCVPCKSGADCGSCFQMTDGRSGVNRLCLQGLQPDHVDAEACVYLSELERNQRPDPVGIPRRARQSDLDRLHPLIRPVGLKQYAARTPPLFLEHPAKARQQTVEARKNIILQPDGVRQGHANGEMIGRSRG